VIRFFGMLFWVGCLFGLLGNGQIEALEKADNAFLMAQSKGPFVLEADDLFPAAKAKPVLKKKVPVKKSRSPLKSVSSKNKTSVHKAKVRTKSKPKKLKGARVVPPSLTQKKAYIFGPEDVLDISVWENPDLKSSMPVRPDGFISFPLIGDVLAQGLTPAQLKNKITVRLKKFITDPIVTVVVKKINSIKISVAGEVNEPDSYQVNRPITLLHLFALAQGFTEKADLKRSYLLRNGKKLDIDFFALVKKDDFSQNIWLQSGDLVFIHDNFEGRINIMGEIKLPQVVSFQEGMTVLDAILMANGLTDIAKPEGTKVYRKSKNAGGNSEIKIIPVEMGRVIFEGDLSKNIRLQPGDIIHVPRSFF
jgi:polysaccharide biosynthesis/export protein